MKQSSTNDFASQFSICCIWKEQSYMTGTFDPANCNVALLAGGTSKEREVSLDSGKGALQALEQSGFKVTVIDPARREDLARLVQEDFDVAFIALHGKHGEDGTMQGFLDIAGIPYIGSGVCSSSLAMDKSKSKIFYEHAGIQTPHSQTITSEQDIANDENRRLILDKVGLPCIVKPSTEGSAVGIFIVGAAEELEDACRKALELDSEVLVETYIKGVELTVAVLGNDKPEALPIIEIIPENEFYDYHSKYAPGGSQHICPARLDDETTKKVQNIALHAHVVLGCRGMSRSDFILDDKGEIWILETNTVPGMTETSLLPDAGRAAGLSFPEICKKLVMLALEDK